MARADAERGRRRALRHLAELARAPIVGDPDVVIDRVSSVDEAQPGCLTFAVDDRWLAKALASKASAVIVPRAAAQAQREDKSLLIADDVRAALAAILKSFEPALPAGEFTHPSAVVDGEISRGRDVWIGPGAIVCGGAALADGVRLLAGAYVGRDAQIGARTLLHPRASVLDECVIGDDCVLQAGCVVGSDGFGFVRVGAEQIKIPQIGNVVVGDRVEIGACSTIDRAVTGSTTIGAGTKIDNLVQIAHNVQIGEDCTICAQTGIAGSTIVEPHVTFAGQAGIGGHITIGARSLILGQAGVSHSLPKDSVVSGTLARPHREDLQQQVLVRRLPKLVEQVRALAEAVDELRKRST